MQEALILKLIILALAVTFIAVIIALVLSFNVTQKLMKHNASLVGQMKESDKQKASTTEPLRDRTRTAQGRRGTQERPRQNQRDATSSQSG